MMRMHKVLVLDEVQNNVVEKLDDKSELAVKINGNFCWQLGEKDKEDIETVEPLGRGGRFGGGRGGMRRAYIMF